MTEEFRNVYADDAGLAYPGTYYLAFRDLPALFERHVGGGRALDFGCGAGRSTRFLRSLGFDAIGVDIAEPMLERARAADPTGDYRRVPDGRLEGVELGAFDLVLCAFTFDNIPTMEKKVGLLGELRRRLRPGGRIVNLVSSPEIYTHEWASFSTQSFPENQAAKSGDRVRIVMLDVEDRRPVEDVLCTPESYGEAYARAELAVLEVHRPLGLAADPVSWTSETTVAPWTIYVLGSSTQDRPPVVQLQKSTASPFDSASPVPSVFAGSRWKNWYQRVVPTISGETAIGWTATPVASRRRTGSLENGDWRQSVPLWKGIDAEPAEEEKKSPSFCGSPPLTTIEKGPESTLGTPLHPSEAKPPEEFGLATQ
jgi:SAM-dependent methyltransferase